MKQLLQTSIKVTKSFIFFILIFILFYLLLGNRFKYGPISQTIITLTLTYSAYCFLFILIFKIKKPQNSFLRLIFYLLLGIPLQIFFLEITSFISDIYAFNSESQDYLIQKYQVISALDYAQINLGKELLYYLKAPFIATIGTSIFTSITLITGIFLELTWRKENLNISSNSGLNYLLIILLFIPSFISSYQFSLEFFESFLKTTLYLLSNIVIIGITIYQIFCRLNQKIHKWIPISPYFITGILLSIFLAYLWYFMIPLRVYGNEPFSLLALVGQGWLQALIWLYIFNVYAANAFQETKSLQIQIH